MRVISVRTLATAVLAGTAVAGFCGLSVVAQGFAGTDEAWFLQVVDRVASGETLYRDVYFNVTPLSVYLTASLTAFFPMELVVVRSVVAAALVTTIAICWMLCRELGAGRLAPWLLVASWARPAPYTPLAMTFFVAAFFATIVWLRRTHEGRDSTAVLAFAGILAGFCFVTKQNLGLFCLSAILLSIAIARSREVRARRGMIVAMAGFATSAALVGLPIYLSGGGDRFLLYGFGKVAYLQVGGVPYSAALDRLRLTVADGWSLEAIADAYRECVFLLPAAAALLLGTACVRAHGRERRIALVVTTFVAAGYLVVFPRPGGSSIIFAIPILVVGLAYGWTVVRPFGATRWAPVIPVLVTLLFAAQFGVRLARYSVAMVSPEYRTSDIAHFSGIRVREAEYGTVRDEVARLSRLANAQPLYLMGPNTGFYYLAAGIRNPNPFDFAYASVFGTTGQQEVIGAVEQGHIRSVFIFSTPMGRQTPTILQNFVRGSMLPVHRERFGVLYRAPGRKVASRILVEPRP